MNLTVTSIAFQDGQPIPPQYTGDGSDASPPLRWNGVPPGAGSLALLCEDPDAPRRTWTHWVAFNLPAGSRELSGGIARQDQLPNGASQGTNDFGKVGYGGPAPPPGRPHRYFFRLYALDTKLDLAPGATRQELLEAMKGHVLAEGQIMGTYGREGR
jgi:Raf kinase inhibitor-like YbhB/YbcL family protein